MVYIESNLFILRLIVEKYYLPLMLSIYLLKTVKINANNYLLVPYGELKHSGRTAT